MKRLSKLVAAVSTERYRFVGNTVKSGAAEAMPAAPRGQPRLLPRQQPFRPGRRWLIDADLSTPPRSASSAPTWPTPSSPIAIPIDQELTVNGAPIAWWDCSRRRARSFGGSNDNSWRSPFTAFDEQFPEIKKRRRRHDPHRHVPKRSEATYALIDDETGSCGAAGPAARPGNDSRSSPRGAGLRNFQQITGGGAAAMIVIAGIALMVGGSA